MVLRCFPDVAVPEIASHRHCAAAVTLAVRRGVPAIVLVREPAAAIASNAVRFGFSPESAADDYIDFHVAVARELAAGAPITVVEFKNLLGDTREFARIVGRLLGITFDPEQAASAKEDFDAMMRGSLNELARLPNEWTLPHPEKDRLKDDVARRLAADRQRLERAARVYADVVRLAGLDAPR